MPAAIPRVFRAALLASVVFASTAAVLSGCAANLATGERHLNLTSEAQEISMGKQADQAIIASLRLYPDSSLQRYVRQLGTTLAATSERPQLPWTFRVMDDPAVNAFALPGGVIYVTRGILAHLDNEAELAGILGHEIGHVTAQHSVHRMATQQVAQLGLGIGTMLKPGLQRYAGLAGTGLGLLFLKFSRDDERQADELGVRYMTRSHHDPHQMGEVMTMLERVSLLGGDNGRVPGWLATHPDPGDRRERIEALAATTVTAGGGPAVDRATYLRRLDSLVYGRDPREGYFEGETFFHPVMGFRFEFPRGWTTSNQKQGVMAVSKNQDAIVQVALSSKKSPAEAASEFFSQTGVTAQGAGSKRIHGLSASAGDFTAQTEEGTLRGTAAFLAYEGRVFELLGYTGQPNWRSYESELKRAIQSFDRLTDAGKLGVQPQRLEIVKVSGSMSLAEFDRRHPSGVSLEILALINQMEPGAQLRTGDLVKRVVGESFE